MCLWGDLVQWIGSNHLGDVASVVGVAISFVGFGITILSTLRSKKASERTEKAVRDVKDSIALFEVVVDFSAAITLLDEIKRAHRQQRWEFLPDRYAALRKILITLRVSTPNLTSKQLTSIQSALTNVSSLEQAVERALASGTLLTASRFNKLLSINIDELHEILTEIKTLRLGV